MILFNVMHPTDNLGLAARKKDFLKRAVKGLLFPISLSIQRGWVGVGVRTSGHDILGGVNICFKKIIEAGKMGKKWGKEEIK
jgi:hypothetical protein